jgi:hypothetical protein
MSASKLDIADVALARLIARDRALPHGWQTELARSRRVSLSAVVAAVGGKSHRWLREPKPVPSYADGRVRCSAGHTTTRWRCPRCGRTKARSSGCVHTGHRVDHRSTRHQAARPS